MIKVNGIVYFTVKEVAALYAVPESVIERGIMAGEFKCVKIDGKNFIPDYEIGKEKDCIRNYEKSNLHDQQQEVSLTKTESSLTVKQAFEKYEKDLGDGYVKVIKPLIKTSSDFFEQKMDDIDYPEITNLVDRQNYPAKKTADVKKSALLKLLRIAKNKTLKEACEEYIAYAKENSIKVKTDEHEINNLIHHAEQYDDAFFKKNIYEIRTVDIENYVLSHSTYRDREKKQQQYRALRKVFEHFRRYWNISIALPPRTPCSKEKDAEIISREQTVVPEEEKVERFDKENTQGRKECAGPRINMAFTRENYKFLQTMSKVCGTTITKFANTIIRTYREDHQEYMQKVEELRALGGLDFGDED